MSGAPVWSLDRFVDTMARERFERFGDAPIRGDLVGLITTEDVQEAVSTAKSLGLKVGGYFMIGAPTETEEEIEHTIRFAARLPIDEAAFNITTPLPGTRLWEQTQDMVGGNIAEFDYYHTSVYNSPNVLPARKLQWLKRKAYLKFYLFSPRRVPNVLKWSTSRQGIHKMMLRMKRF